jgi:hypothetical protein
MYGSFDLGWAYNAGAAYALGGSVFLGGDNRRAHVGVRARVRRWLARNVSLDLSPGVILAGDGPDGTDLLPPGFIAQASVMADDRVGVVGQVYSIRRESGITLDSYAVDSPEPVRETRWYAGVRLGAEPGVVAAALVVALGAAAVLSGPAVSY